MEKESLPGWELIGAGIQDLERGVESPSALLVAIGEPRLRRAGIAVPEHGRRAEEYPRNFVLVDVRPGHPGGDYPFRGWIKLRSFHAVLEFVASGIEAAPEVDVEKLSRSRQVEPARLPDPLPPLPDDRLGPEADRGDPGDDREVR